MDGFLKLHQMEVEDNEGDPSELWITLDAMGYNKNLDLDEAGIFAVFVNSNSEGNFHLEVSGRVSFNSKQVTLEGYYVYKSHLNVVTGMKSGTSLVENVLVSEESKREEDSIFWPRGTTDGINVFRYQ